MAEPEAFSPFKYIDSICESKDDMMVDDASIKGYNSFMVNRHLSYFTDTVLFAVEMNRLVGVDPYLQYHYLLHVVRRKKRRTKWHKREKDETVQLLVDQLGYNYKRARESVRLLSADQIEVLKKRAFRGGVGDNGK